MNHELHGLDAYLTRADDDLPSGDGRKPKPLMLHCSCGAVLPVSDAAQPHIAAGHVLRGRNGTVQQFSESWRTKPLSTTPMDHVMALQREQNDRESLAMQRIVMPVRCASCDDDCTGAVYQYVAGSAVCCDACARAVLASLEE